MSNAYEGTAGNRVSTIHEPSVVNACSVVIHATTVTISQDKPEPDGSLRCRYTRNAAILALLTVLLTIWFQLHLNTWATQGLLFGTATVWALWQFVLSSTKADFAKDGEKVRKRLLGSEDAGSLLVLGCLVSIALLGLTTSVYVKLDDRDTARLRLDLIDRATGKPFMDSIVVEPSSRVRGGVLFPRRKTVNVDVIVVQPPGYEYAKNPVELKPWSGVELTFGDPAQFRKKKMHAVRVVPGWTWNGMDAPGHRAYDLAVRVGKDAFVVPDVSFKTIYFGVADEHSLGKLIESGSNAAFAVALQDHLNNCRGWYPGDEKQYLTDWQKPPRPFITRDFQEGETVVAGIGLHGGQPTWSKPVTIAPDAEITTIFVEKPQ